MLVELFNPTTKDTYASIFTALSEPVRIEIIGMVASADELACTVLDETLPISKSTISYHIKILYNAHLIEVRKSGRYYFYKLRREFFDTHLPGFLDRVLEADRVSRQATGRRRKAVGRG